MNLVIDNIVHRFGDTQFSYNARVSSSITGIFGNSGSGKTTLLNILCGIIKPGAGKIIYNDRTFFDSKQQVNLPEYVRNIGVVFQEHNLFPHLTAHKNLLYSKPYTKNKKQYIAYDTVVDLLDLNHLLHKKPVQLSGGERQRVAIGRSLLSQPELLLLDEPFANLDRDRRGQIISYLLKINNHFDIPLLIISHDLEDMLKLTRSFLVINNGSVSAAGDYINIMERQQAGGLINGKQFINVIELYNNGYNKDDKMYTFGAASDSSRALLRTNVQAFVDSGLDGNRVRLGIAPDDISLSSAPIENSSIQNQVEGKVVNISYSKKSCFVTIDCGIELIAEVTDTAVNKLNISPGQSLYLQVKAKAIEIIHIYKQVKKVTIDNKA